MTDYQTYLSPFSWRYGSEAMRQIWSELNKRLLWRRIWVALAETQAAFGLVNAEQVADLQAHAENIDIERALEIEAEIHHDVMAEIKTYAEQCAVGGGVIHLGATSMDVVDNGDALRVTESLRLILPQFKHLLAVVADQIEQHADRVVMAHTHIQPAEPTTLGYRLAQTGQELLADLAALEHIQADYKGKGFKGAVGTGAAYAELVGRENLDDFENQISEKLGLPFFPASTQTYTRKQDYYLISALAGLGASLYKLAFDFRILQSPPFGEISEPFGSKQVGSTAMPFKRNPINAEKINSLGRALAQLPRLAWDNAAHSLLERTLDDSANRRTLLPEAFLLTDELIAVSHKIVSRMMVNEAAIAKNLATYGPFAATERVLMAAVKAGGDRQTLHEKLREQALAAWEAIQNNQPNPLVDNLKTDDAILVFLSPGEIEGLMNAGKHVGNAPERAKIMAAQIRNAIQ